MTNPIVKLAVEAYFSKGIDPNLIVATWADKVQPSYVELKKIAIDINKELYKKGLASNKLDNLPLINVEEVAKRLKDLENSSRSEYRESGPTLDSTPAISSFSDIFTISGFDNYLDELTKESLKKEASTEKEVSLKKKVKDFVLKKYKPFYEIVKEAAMLYVGEIEAKIDDLTEEFLRLHRDERLSKRSIVKVASDFIKDKDLLKMMLTEFNRKLLKMYKEANLNPMTFEKGFIDLDGRRYLLNVNSSVIGKINDIASKFDAEAYYNANKMVSSEKPYKDVDHFGLVQYIDGYPDETNIDFTPILNALKSMTTLFKQLKKVGAL